MNYDLSNSFSAILNFIFSAFRSVLNWLDSILIFGGNVSLLDLNIAFAVMGLLFTALFAVVKNGVSSSIGKRDRSSKKDSDNNDS